MVVENMVEFRYSFSMEKLYETLLFEKTTLKGFGMLSQEEDWEPLTIVRI